MKNILLLILTFFFSAVSANAETAILCGDIQKTFESDANAEVHTDFDRDVVNSKNDVKFLSVFGKDQKVIKAYTTNSAESKKVVVITKNETYLFDLIQPGICDQVQTLNVSLAKANKTLKCICYED